MTTPRRRKSAMSAEDWHEALKALQPAYNVFAAISMSYRTQTLQHKAAEISMNVMQDLAKLHGRPDAHYFGALPNDRRAASLDRD